MMNISTMRIAAAAAAVACATAAGAATQPAALSVTQRWTTGLVLIGLVALGGVLLLKTRWGTRRNRPEPVEPDASTVRSRDEQFAHELKILWDKPTTRETLCVLEDAQAGAQIAASPRRTVESGQMGESS